MSIVLSSLPESVGLNKLFLFAHRTSTITVENLGQTVLVANFGNKSNPLNTLVLAWLQKCTPYYLKLSEVSTIRTFSNLCFVLDFRLCNISIILILSILTGRLYFVISE